MSDSQDLYTYTATATITAAVKRHRNFRGRLIDVQTQMPSSCLPSTTRQAVGDSLSVLATVTPLCPADVTGTKRYIYKYTYDAVAFLETPTTTPGPTSTSVPRVLDEPESPRNSGLTTAQIVGISIGCCIGLAVLFVAASYLSRGCRGWRRKPKPKNDSSVPVMPTAAPGEKRMILPQEVPPAPVGAIPKPAVPPGQFYEAVAATPPRGMLPGDIHEALRGKKVGVIRVFGTPSKNPASGKDSAPQNLQAPRPSGWTAAAAARPLPPTLENIAEDELYVVLAQDGKGNEPARLLSPSPVSPLGIDPDEVRRVEDGRGEVV